MFMDIGKADCCINSLYGLLTAFTIIIIVIANREIITIRRFLKIDP